MWQDMNTKHSFDDTVMAAEAVTAEQARKLLPELTAAALDGGVSVNEAASRAGIHEDLCDCEDHSEDWMDCKATLWWAAWRRGRIFSRTDRAALLQALHECRTIVEHADVQRRDILDEEPAE